jgi:hypothetical protein
VAEAAKGEAMPSIRKMDLASIRIRILHSVEYAAFLWGKDPISILRLDGAEWIAFTPDLTKMS